MIPWFGTFGLNTKSGQATGRSISLRHITMGQRICVVLICNFLTTVIIFNCFKTKLFLSVSDQGVYAYNSGKYVTTQAVKIIGWGEENGTPYWLAANSFNTYWGDNGYVKILRGANECYIEEYMYGGLPL